MIKTANKDRTATNRSIYFAVTIGIGCSIILILSGIFNVKETSEITDRNIKTSLDIQNLSNALKIHHESMNSSIDYAMTSGEAHWRNNYENSLLKMQDVVDTSSNALNHEIVEGIQRQSENAIAAERDMFKHIAKGNIDAAFAIMASEVYQENKIRQEQQALTLRAMLDGKAKESVEVLKQKLEKTTYVLTGQIAFIVIIWMYIVQVLKRWQAEQQTHSNELTQLAHYDSLTGIGNRTLFHLRLQEAFNNSLESGSIVGLLLMDIDHFKDINDNLGHDVGDELLIKVASELKHLCRENDTVIRLGGDEFAIIVTGLEQKRDTAVLGNKILSLFEEELSVKHHEIKTGTSIGMAFFPDDADSAEELLRKADMALYEAKRNGRGNFKYFNVNIENLARKKLEMQASIDHAIEHNEFELYYQPLVALSTNRIIGVESLIRWHHPKHGMVPPDQFISVAEEKSRQIVAIGEWVLREACRQQVQWEKEGLPPIGVAVNLSGIQFDEPHLLDTVEKIMRETGIKRNLLTLEITESTLMETGGDVIAKLHALNSLGLKLAIDDFGTGYSSLAYLKRFPIHHLKIDREFVKDLPHDSHDIAIARSIIKMAHELKIDVVAEGIEDISQCNFLKNAECNYGQGYYFGKPMRANDLKDWVERTQQHYSNVRSIANV